MNEVTLSKELSNKQKLAIAKELWRQIVLIPLVTELERRIQPQSVGISKNPFTGAVQMQYHKQEFPTNQREKQMSTVIANLVIKTGPNAGKVIPINSEKASLIVSEHDFVCEQRKAFVQGGFYPGGKLAYRSARDAGDFENAGSGTGVFDNLFKAAQAVLEQDRADRKAQAEAKARVAASYGVSVDKMDKIMAIVNS